ncbi:YczE/YyaS/YitT family protein [Aquibacillus rhizosphaerae]|uniref:YitT family protein n=1 Tax=Aquibacillus rhizosphaerae TaxID=3051431 RepID=A0ABT7L0Q1_9BACI|nr:YitT family protein [Aquibacillus sp. LR5S19]MDL4839354.1 YitT family protein [Aquibacillus sp. LR5S19]
MRLFHEGFHFYICGILILTLGIALTIQSQLGASPFDALLVGLHRTFGLTIGSWEIVVGLTMVLCNSIAEKKRPEYYALLTSFITGAGIDFWLLLINNWIAPEAWMGQYISLTIGILLTGIGVATYLQSTFAPNPLDRSMLIISRLTGWNMTYSRAFISIILVILAFFFNGAIGIGTLINALVTGALITIFLPYIKAIYDRLSARHNTLSS